MSSVLEKLRADFAPRAQEKNCCKLTLSNGEEITIWFRTCVNVIEQDKYFPLLQEGKLEGYVELLIARARGEDDTKMFKPKDKAVLMKNVDPEIIVDVGNKILGVDQESAEENKKLSAEIAKK